MIARQPAGRPLFPVTLPNGNKRLRSYAAIGSPPAILQYLPRIFGSLRAL